MPGRAAFLRAEKALRCADQVLLPIERSLLPCIKETEHKLENEDHHRHPAGPADLTQADGPGEEKGCFQIEHDEKNGDQVETHVKLAARIFKCGETAFILGKLVWIGFVGAGKTRSEEHTSELQSLMSISYAVF